MDWWQSGCRRRTSSNAAMALLQLLVTVLHAPPLRSWCSSARRRGASRGAAAPEAAAQGRSSTPHVQPPHSSTPALTESCGTASASTYALVTAAIIPRRDGRRSAGTGGRGQGWRTGGGGGRPWDGRWRAGKARRDGRRSAGMARRWRSRTAPGRESGRVSAMSISERRGARDDMRDPCVIGVRRRKTKGIFCPYGNTARISNMRQIVMVEVKTV
ncbi:hypothetical protein BS78_04G137400 [Paspalum vaginatum]|nr:hypothetical protein BS78_04G137400 [Paspalum vaginatum]